VRVRRLGGDRAGEIRITRFLRNPSVSLGEMVDTAFARCAAACAGREVLAIQDTTVTRSSGGGGSYLHAMVAVDAANGAMLGVLDAQFLERRDGKAASRHHRAFGEKESARWLAGAVRAGRIEGAARVCVVADREADIAALFAQRPAHGDVLVRAMHDRTLADGGKLAAHIARGPRLGRVEHALAAVPGRAARSAALSVRFGRITLRRPTAGRAGGAVPPPHRGRKTLLRPRAARPETGADSLAPIALNYVDLCEETPPPGTPPVHWRLLTTLPVDSVADAIAIGERYARRWKIEEVFRTMKRKGFDIEALRIKDEAPRNRLILACLVAACIVLQMTADRDGQALRPITDAFDPEDRPFLEAVSRTLEGRTARQKNPHPPGSLAFAAWVCARLGGWTGYYGKPGPIVILNGWIRFQTLKTGAHIASITTQKIRQDV
jgi:hypothetical protein